jgi:ArsR family transcriptional regulator
MKSSTPPLPAVVDARALAAARRGLPDEEVLRDATEVFKALASPVRLSIMHALAHDEMSVGDLAQALDLSLSVTSHQLSLLRRMKLVAGRDQGRLTFYRVIDEFVWHLIHDCLGHVGAMLGRSSDHLHPHRASSAKSSDSRRLDDHRRSKK